MNYLGCVIFVFAPYMIRAQPIGSNSTTRNFRYDWFFRPFRSPFIWTSHSSNTFAGSHNNTTEKHEAKVRDINCSGMWCLEKCILSSQLCDGIKDCFDGSDEHGCGKQNIVKKSHGQFWLPLLAVGILITLLFIMFLMIPDPFEEKRDSGQHCYWPKDGGNPQKNHGLLFMKSENCENENLTEYERPTARYTSKILNNVAKVLKV